MAGGHLLVVFVLEKGIVKQPLLKSIPILIKIYFFI